MRLTLENTQAEACRPMQGRMAQVLQRIQKNILHFTAVHIRTLAVLAVMMIVSIPAAFADLNRTTCNYVGDPDDATTSWQTVSGTLANSSTYDRYDFYLEAGYKYIFSLCTDDGGSASYDSYLGLYPLDYDCYDDLSAAQQNSVITNDDACGTRSKIEYTATSTGWTSLYISGFGTAYGSYTLAYKYEIAASAPANSTCATATSLPCGTSNLAGTTIGTPGTAHGTGASVSNYGVWYTFTGNGGETTISSSATFDHRIVVTKGSCGNLTLVASVDNSTGTESYTFTTEVGVTYYVYIAHYSSTSTSTGTFTISRTCPPPANSTCATATSLPCGTSNLAGTTIGTPGTAHGTGLTASNYGVWYTFTGDGNETTVSSTATFDHVMIIVSGSCGNFTTVIRRDATSGSTETYTFNTVSGTTYYVYIAHYSASSSTTGSFTISRTCPPPCENATTLPCGTTNLAGTTAGSSGSPHGTGYDISNYGVWYTFVGDGIETTITSTAASGYDHEMAIVSGTCGGTFTQIADKDAGVGGGTESYTFTPVNGVTYYVYIAHYSSTSDQTGAFTISRICCTDRTASITNCPGTMTSGQQLALNGSTTPAGSGTVTWTSSNNSVVSLSGSTATAGTPGTATVTYTRAYDGAYCEATTTCSITVTCATNTSTFAFSPATGSVAEDGTLNISGNLTLPTGATVTSYTSDNTGVATVTSAGVVTGVSSGTAHITATVSQWTYDGITYCQRTTTNSFTVTVTGGFTCESTNTKEIGTAGGTSYQYGPVNTNYYYSIYQIIYDPSELCAGPISGVAFHYAYSSASPTRNDVGIFLGTRASSTFSSASDWTPASEMTEVYRGPFNFHTANWKWFAFNTPYVYSGDGSLVMMIVDYSHASWNSSCTFYYSSCDGYKMIRAQKDGNTPYDETNLSEPSWGLNNVRPDTRFCINCCTERTGTAGFDFCRDALTIDVGSSSAITMPVEGAEGVSPTGAVSYSSSNTSVATVSGDGTVTGVANGSATITATMAYNDPAGYCSVVAKYNVQVGPPPPCFEIGTGTDAYYYPIPGFYGNQYDVYIYTPTAAPELNNNLTITSIAYYITSTNATSTSQMTVWVKDVDPATTLAAGTTFATYINGASQVYNNTSYSAPNTGWQTLDFSSSFSHTGGKALLVAVRGYGCSTSGGCSRYCRYTSATNTHWYKHNDGTDQGQSVSGTLDGQRANIKLCYEATAFTPDVMPTVEVTNATQPTVCSGNAIENMGVTASDAVTFSPALNTLGLSYNTSTHVISGTPNFTGTQTVTVTVTSSDGCLKATKDLTITVNQLGASINISVPEP